MVKPLATFPWSPTRCPCNHETMAPCWWNYVREKERMEIGINTGLTIRLSLLQASHTSEKHYRSVCLLYFVIYFFLYNRAYTTTLYVTRSRANTDEQRRHDMLEHQLVDHSQENANNNGSNNNSAERILQIIASAPHIGRPITHPLTHFLNRLFKPYCLLWSDHHPMSNLVSNHLFLPLRSLSSLFFFSL